MQGIKSYKDLIVWQKAIDLAVEIYKISALFPRSELFGLTMQIRKAANSISLNTAEGHGRNTTKNYVAALYIAKGSLQEVESALILAVRLGFIEESFCEKANSLILEEYKMFNALINSLEDKYNKN